MTSSNERGQKEKTTSSSPFFWCCTCSGGGGGGGGGFYSRERSSNFSLEFLAIGQSVSGEARSKVAPHGKGYTWVLVLWSFEKLKEVGVFSYLYYSLAKGHFNGWGFVKAWMTVVSAPKDLDRVKKSL